MKLLNSEVVDFFIKNEDSVEGIVTTKTKVKLNKKDTATKTIPNTLGEIYKVQKIKALFNEDYEAIVNEELEKEVLNPEFVSKQRKWGKHISKAIVEKEDGKQYLCLFEKSKLGDIKYELETGEEIDISEFKAFFPPSTSKPIVEGLEANVIKYKSFSLSSILEIELN